MLTTVLAIAVLAAIAAVVLVGMRPRPGDNFTEFYLLGSGGTAGDYPSEVVLGADASILVGVVNHEGEEVVYEVRIVIGGDEAMVVREIALHDREKWEDGVAFTPVKAGDNQRVEFLLYRDGGPEPYHVLHLWMDVVNP